MLCARFLIQLSSAAPLGRVERITWPCACAALSKGLLAGNSSSTSTIKTVESGRPGIASARPFSKLARDSPPALLLFPLRPLPAAGASAFSAGTAESEGAGESEGEESSPRRFLGKPSRITRRCSERKGKVLQVAVRVARETSPPT